MTTHDAHPPSLLELFRRAVRRHAEQNQDVTPPPDRNNPDAIVSRRDEKGAPYKGDLPNPTQGTYRGCF